MRSGSFVRVRLIQIYALLCFVIRIRFIILLIRYASLWRWKFIFSYARNKKDVIFFLILFT